MKTKELTSRQREALEFIQEFIAKKGYSPSLTEIGNGIDLTSKSTTHGIIHRLQEKGYITFEATLPRSIRLTGQNDELSCLRRRVAELEAMLQLRPDITTMNRHDTTLSTVIEEARAALG